MDKLVRFGVSVEEGLLKKFDAHIQGKKYVNRSEAIRDLIRADLVKKHWQENQEVAGAITIVYDHHQRELVNKLMDIQHDFGELVVSTQHVHLDHHNCLEIIVVRGPARKTQILSDMLKAVKGVRHASLSMSSTGKDI